MTYTLTEDGINHGGFNYPFVKPQGFDEWLSTKRDSFIQGYLHAYIGAVTNKQPLPTQEEPLL